MRRKDQALSVVETDNEMTLRFWGVRGSLPAPGAATARYGGNTLCVELLCGPHLLILDAGSGLRELGTALTARGVPVDVDILLSHTHLDHICGLPFFAVMYDPQARIRFWEATWRRRRVSRRRCGSVGARRLCPIWTLNFVRTRHSMISSREIICNCIRACASGRRLSDTRATRWVSDRVGWIERLLHHRHRASGRWA